MKLVVKLNQHLGDDYDELEASTYEPREFPRRVIKWLNVNKSILYCYNFYIN